MYILHGGIIIKLNKYFLFFIILAVLLSVSVSFASDENSTNVISDSVDGSVVETSDNSALSVDYLDAVNDNSSTIKTGKVTKRYVNGVEYSATFLDENGTPLKDTIVYCGVDSLFVGVNATTNSNGIALFLLPINKGTHTLYLMNFVTSDITNDTIQVFDVLTGNKDYNVYFNSGKSYTVRVYGDDGKPVKANQKVTFTVNFKKQTVKTDKNGYARLNINFQPGSYLVTAQYKDFLVFNKVVVKPTLIPLTQFGAKKLSKTFKFKVKLLDNKGKVSKNKKVKLKFNKKTYTAKTNKKGIATFTLKTPSKAGKFNIVASYGKAKADALLVRYRI